MAQTSHHSIELYFHFNITLVKWKIYFASLRISTANDIAQMLIRCHLTLCVRFMTCDVILGFR